MQPLDRYDALKTLSVLHLAPVVACGLAMLASRAYR
jgi:hypothetical protein